MSNCKNCGPLPMIDRNRDFPTLTEEQSATLLGALKAKKVIRFMGKFVQGQWQIVVSIEAEDGEILDNSIVVQL